MTCIVPCGVYFTYNMKGIFFQAILVILLMCATNVKLEDTCAGDNIASCVENDSRYSEEINEDARYLQLIEEAVASYVPCSQENCSCHAQVITRDLKPFKKHGIDKNMIGDAWNRGTKYQIIGHRLYRDKDCMFPARCAGIEHFVKPLLKNLPDMELIVNTRDWPQVNKKFGPPRAVFSFSKTAEYSDVLYPAWSFWEGGPAIGLYPRGLGRWDELREELAEAAARWPWEEKKPLAFFRGSRTSAERDALVRLARARPDVADAAYTRNQAWKSDADTLGLPPAQEVSLADHCQYRFLFDFRGVAASFRLKHLFLCGSLVFRVGGEWEEFFYPSLRPWVHYVPVAADASEEQLRRLVAFARRQDAAARAIAERGRRHVRDHLRMRDVSCYWRRLLRRYAKLLTYRPLLNATLVRIE